MEIDLQKIKKEFLDNLYYEKGKQQFDFDVCSLYKDKEGNSKSRWKWGHYSEIGFDVEKNKRKFNQINCRAIFPNEVVIDLETKEDIESILKELEKSGFYYECYETGSRGFHIHLWFDEEISSEDKEKFILIFKGDTMKKSDRNVIALENYPHWKTGRVKNLFKNKEGINKYTKLKDFLENYIPYEYRTILKSKKLFEMLDKELSKKIVSEEKSRKTLLLALCSVWLKNPKNKLHTFVSSISSSGKSFICDKIVKLFPENMVICRSKITPEVLTYWHANDDNWSWDGKILYLEDIKQDVLDSSTFKVMLSEGSTATVTIKQQAIDLEIKGKPLILLTTASTNPTDEIINRFQIISLDESEIQTSKIAKNIALQQIEQNYDSTIKNSLKFLKECTVYVPFANEIYLFLLRNGLFKDVRMRRDFNKLLDLIKSSTALHQIQRRKNNNGMLISTREDYEIARECINYIETNTFLGLVHNLRKAFEYCKKLFQRKGKFTAREIYTEYPFVSPQMWYEYLPELSKRNILIPSLEKTEDSFKPVTYYSVLERKSFCLPDYEILISESKQEELHHDKEN